MEKLKFIVTRFLGLLVIIYLIIVSYIYFNQEEMIFFPKKLSKEFKFQFEADFEELNISSFDGNILNGLLFKSKISKGVVFYLHGNAGSLDTWGNISKNYTDLGYDIFILDYRGFGKSEGNIDSENQFCNDITTAYKFIKSKYGENKIVIVGYSIGTGPATILASQYKPKSLVLQAPYFNFEELAGNKIPFIPDFLKKYKFETNRFITKVKTPVFIFHGNEDNVIPINNSVRLNQLLKSNNHFYKLNNEDHIGINENQYFLSELKNILQ